MPLYEYYCRRCEQRFELLRPVARMDEPALCPKGHGGGERVLSTFAAFSQERRRRRGAGRERRLRRLLGRQLRLLQPQLAVNG